MGVPAYILFTVILLSISNVIISGLKFFLSKKQSKKLEESIINFSGYLQNVSSFNNPFTTNIYLFRHSGSFKSALLVFSSIILITCVVKNYYNFKYLNIHLLLDLLGYVFAFILFAGIADKYVFLYRVKKYFFAAISFLLSQILQLKYFETGCQNNLIF
jgi:hypothetical protein